MYSVSEAYSKAIAADTREMPYRVRLAGAIVLDQTKIPSMIINESASGSNGVSIGTANSASLKLTIRKAETIDYNDVLVEPESGLVLPNGTIEWIPLGKFWVTSSSTSNDYETVTLNCADGMYHLTDEYESNLTYPTTLKAVVNEIIAMSGVGFVGFDALPDITIRRNPGKMTLRDAVGYAAGCCGKNARFNRQGNLEFFWYSDTGITLERRTQYLNGMTKLNAKPLEVSIEVVGNKEVYSVNVISGGNGGVSATPGQQVLEDDTVVLSVNPFYGYELATISAVTEHGDDVTLYKSAEGGYTFIQPDSNVTVTAAFRKVDANSYSITVRAYDGGSIRVDATEYAEGTKPTVYIKTNEGYELDKFVTTPASVSLSRLGTNADGETLYEFTMPKSDVTVNAYFKETKKAYLLKNYVESNGYIIATNLTSGEYVFYEGDIVQVHFMGEDGYTLDRYESTVEMVQIDTDKYQFTMPKSDVTTTAYFKEADDESKVGLYSWLALPSNNTPPTQKPYWAVFYKYSASVPASKRFYLVWFDSWSATSSSSAYGKTRYSIQFNGYYYCGSKDMGHYPQAWDTSTWQGNGASGSTLTWISTVGGTWADDGTASANYSLIASNVNLYRNGTILFQKCESSIQHSTQGYVINGMDVRERGAFGYYKCPDTFSTPAPAANWMILNAYGLLMEKDADGKYSESGSSSRGLYVVWFDSIAVENVGKVLAINGKDEEFYIASVTNGHYALLCEESRTWGTLKDIAANQVIGLRNPLISEEYVYGSVGSGSYRFNGLTVSSCNISGSGTLLRYKNDCKICDCATATATEVMKFSLRRTVSNDEIIIDSDDISVSANGDTIVFNSALLSVSAVGDTLKISVGNAEKVNLTYNNPFIYEKAVESVASLVQDVTYTPAKVKHRGNPALQVGDIVTVPDKDGVPHRVLIMQQTFTFGGGMNSEITAPGQTDRQTSFSSNGPLTTQIKKEVHQSNAELERRLSANNALVFAALQRSIGLSESKIESVVEWQTEKSATIASLEQTSSAHGASIDLLTKALNENTQSLAELSLKADANAASIGLLVENGNVKASVVVGAINNSESVVSISGNRFVVNSTNFVLSQDGSVVASNLSLTGGKIILEHSNKRVSIGESSGVHVKALGAVSGYYSAAKYDAETLAFQRGTSLTGSFTTTAQMWHNHYTSEPYVMMSGSWVNASGSAITSDAKLKHDIESLDNRYDALFDNLIPRRFKYNDGTSGRYHSGYITGEVQDALKNAGIDEKEFAAICTFGDGDDEFSALRYTEFVALNTWQIQRLKARIEELEAKLGG